MTSAAARLESLQNLARRHARPAFFPFKVLDAVPWLLLACASRLFLSSPAGLFAFVFIQYALLIAFILASRRMIEGMGGATSLGSIGSRGQRVLAGGILGRLLVVFAIAQCVALYFGATPYRSGVFWLGFDALAHGRRGLLILVWSAIVTTIVFLMVVEGGSDRKPGLPGVGRQIYYRWREISLALLLVIAALAVMNAVQFRVATWLQPAYGVLETQIEKNVFRVFYLFVFASARLWIVVAILTMCLRMSYHRRADISS